MFILLARWSERNLKIHLEITHSLFYGESLKSHHLDLFAEFLHVLLNKLAYRDGRIFYKGLIEQNFLFDVTVELALERLLLRGCRQFLYFFFEYFACSCYIAVF